MPVSFLRTASVAVPMLLLAMNVGAADNVKPMPDKLDATGAKVLVFPAVQVGSLNALRDVAVRPLDFRKSARIHELGRLPPPAFNPAFARGVSGDRVVQSRATPFSALAISAFSNLMGLAQGFRGPAGALSVQSVPPAPAGAPGPAQ